MPLDPHPQDDSADATRVLRRFRVVFNAVRTHFQQVEKQVGIGGAQVWALNVVRDQPGIGMGELAKRMDIHQSTASNLVKALLRKELIRASKAAGDRRHVHLYVMPAALALLEQVPGPFEGLLPMALGQLPGQTLQRLDQDLLALTQLLQLDDRAGSIPLAELP